MLPSSAFCAHVCVCVCVCGGERRSALISRSRPTLSGFPLTTLVPFFSQDATALPQRHQGRESATHLRHCRLGVQRDDWHRPRPVHCRQVRLLTAAFTRLSFPTCSLLCGQVFAHPTNANTFGLLQWRERRGQDGERQVCHSSADQALPQRG